MPSLGGAPWLPCARSLGFKNMSACSWEMGSIFIFGRMCGWVGCPLEIDIVDFLSCRYPNGC